MRSSVRPNGGFSFDPEDFIETIGKPYSVAQFPWTFAPVAVRHVEASGGGRIVSHSPADVDLRVEHLDELARLLMASTAIDAPVIPPPSWFPSRDQVSFSGLPATKVTERALIVKSSPGQACRVSLAYPVGEDTNALSRWMVVGNPGSRVYAPLNSTVTSAIQAIAPSVRDPFFSLDECLHIAGVTLSGSSRPIKVAFGTDGNCMICHSSSGVDPNSGAQVVDAIYTTPGDIIFNEPVGSVDCTDLGRPLCVRDQDGSIVPPGHWFGHARLWPKLKGRGFRRPPLPDLSPHRLPAIV